MKILPIFPPFPPSFWSYTYAIELVNKRATMPPTGLASVCAMLPGEHFDVMPIADLNADKASQTALFSKNLDEQIKKADIVFTSSMIVQRDSLKEIIDRSHFFGKKVVAGGPYPTSYRDEVPADYLVLDEAEVTLKPFLEDIINGKASHIYDSKAALERFPATALTKGGKPLLTNTPIPRWDLLDLNNYSSLAIQYSRGCPFNCDFCDITKLFGRESRTKTPEQMIKEIEAIYQTGWRGSIFIVDDNFIGNRREVRKMLPKLIEWQKNNNYPYTFFTEASMDLAVPANEDIRKSMIDAGFDSVFLGIESDDPEVLKGMNKSQNLGAMSPADKIRILQESGFEVAGGFIIGSDKEKPDVFERIFNFIQNSGVVVPMAGLLTALKGTDLYNRLKLEGRLTGETTGNNTHNLSFNFKTRLDEQFLINGYVGLLSRLFDSKNYYDRCRVLNSRRGNYHSSNLVNKDGLRAFAALMYENLIKRRDFEFGKYLFEVAVTHPSKLPEAVTHAAKLRHFRMMTENTVDVVTYTERLNTLYKTFCDRVENIKGSTEMRFQALGKAEDDIMKRARKSYNKLHEDFRGNATNALNGLKKMIHDYKQNYFSRSLGLK